MKPDKQHYFQILLVASLLCPAFIGASIRKVKKEKIHNLEKRKPTSKKKISTPTNQNEIIKKIKESTQQLTTLLQQINSIEPDKEDEVYKTANQILKIFNDCKGIKFTNAVKKLTEYEKYYKAKENADPWSRFAFIKQKFDLCKEMVETKEENVNKVICAMLNYIKEIDFSQPHPPLLIKLKEQVCEWIISQDKLKEIPSIILHLITVIDLYKSSLLNKEINEREKITELIKIGKTKVIQIIDFILNQLSNGAQLAVEDLENIKNSCSLMKNSPQDWLVDGELKEKVCLLHELVSIAIIEPNNSFTTKGTINAINIVNKHKTTEKAKTKEIRSLITNGQIKIIGKIDHIISNLSSSTISLESLEKINFFYLEVKELPHAWFAEINLSEQNFESKLKDLEDIINNKFILFHKKSIVDFKVTGHTLSTINTLIDAINRYKNSKAQDKKETIEIGLEKIIETLNELENEFLNLYWEKPIVIEKYEAKIAEAELLYSLDLNSPTLGAPKKKAEEKQEEVSPKNEEEPKVSLQDFISKEQQDKFEKIKNKFAGEKSPYNICKKKLEATLAASEPLERLIEDLNKNSCISIKNLETEIKRAEKIQGKIEGKDSVKGANLFNRLEEVITKARKIMEDINEKIDDSEEGEILRNHEIASWNFSNFETAKELIEDYEKKKFEVLSRIEEHKERYSELGKITTYFKETIFKGKKEKIEKSLSALSTKKESFLKAVQESGVYLKSNANSDSLALKKEIVDLKNEISEQVYFSEEERKTNNFLYQIDALEQSITTDNQNELSLVIGIYDIISKIHENIFHIDKDKTASFNETILKKKIDEIFNFTQQLSTILEECNSKSIQDMKVKIKNTPLLNKQIVDLKNQIEEKQKNFAKALGIKPQSNWSEIFSGLKEVLTNFNNCKEELSKAQGVISLQGKSLAALWKNNEERNSLQLEFLELQENFKNERELRESENKKANSEIQKIKEELKNARDTLITQEELIKQMEKCIPNPYENLAKNSLRSFIALGMGGGLLHLIHSSEGAPQVSFSELTKEPKLFKAYVRHLTACIKKQAAKNIYHKVALGTAAVATCLLAAELGTQMCGFAGTKIKEAMLKN